MSMHIDFSPLYRTAIGFEHLAHLLENGMDSSTGYPPYNVEILEEDKYQISMAVAGFTQDEIDITSQENSLIVKGRKSDVEGGNRKILYHGIAERNFERKFQLADHVKVVGASLENGLLDIDLHREVPEAMKLRKITINSSEEKLIKTQS